ncbi:hypothetical protein, partial [Streptomyces sp. NPDC052015]|uniref:hypothetical protein n=1 Tax=Streptomyces sp. NPDC052015 TaxID=3154755 RepID=UPI00343C6155
MARTHRSRHTSSSAAVAVARSGSQGRSAAGAFRWAYQAQVPVARAAGPSAGTAGSRPGRAAERVEQPSFRAAASSARIAMDAIRRRSSSLGVRPAYDRSPVYAAVAVTSRLPTGSPRYVPSGQASRTVVAPALTMAGTTPPAGTSMRCQRSGTSSPARGTRLPGPLSGPASTRRV